MKRIAIVEQFGKVVDEEEENVEKALIIWKEESVLSFFEEKTNRTKRKSICEISSRKWSRGGRRMHG